MPTPSRTAVSRKFGQVSTTSRTRAFQAANTEDIVVVANSLDMIFPPIKLNGSEDSPDNTQTMISRLKTTPK